MAVVIQGWSTRTRPASRSPPIRSSGDRDVAVVSAVYGLGEGLVSGELDADTYRVRFGGNRRGASVDVARKDRAVRLRPARTRPLEARARGASDRARARPTTRRVGSRRGARRSPTRSARRRTWSGRWSATAPSARELVVLQTRPITTLARGARSRPAGCRSTPAAARPDGERRVWDNSNIIESYSGVTTPLTFTLRARASTRTSTGSSAGSWA